jgi:hypothetical protein
MAKTVFDIIVGILGAGASIVTIYGVIKIYIVVKFKEETLFGAEAEDRFKQIKAKLPVDGVFGPHKYGGGNINTPKLEVRKVVYDSQTMSPEWKGVKKTLRYFYEEKGDTMIKGWRFK